MAKKSYRKRVSRKTRRRQATRRRRQRGGNDKCGDLTDARITNLRIAEDGQGFKYFNVTGQGNNLSGVWCHNPTGQSQQIENDIYWAGNAPSTAAVKQYCDC
jgi:hypothetical protein